MLVPALGTAVAVGTLTGGIDAHQPAITCRLGCGRACPLRLCAGFDPRKQPAATRQAEAQTQTSQGELLDVDVKASSLTIQTPTAEMTFRYNDQTKVSGAQKGLSSLAMMTGSQVVVQFRKEGQMNVAMSIDVKGAK